MNPAFRAEKGWRGRRESDSQVTCHPIHCMTAVWHGQTRHTSTMSAPQPPQPAQPPRSVSLRATFVSHFGWCRPPCRGGGAWYLSGFALDREARSRPGVTVPGGPTVQSDTGQQVHPSGARALHHGCRVMESAFLPERVPWWPGPRWGALCAECSVKKRQVGGAVARSWRRWRGGEFPEHFFIYGRPYDHAATSSSSLTGRCPRFSSSTEFLLAVVLQTMQTVQPTVEILRCRSWTGS